MVLDFDTARETFEQSTDFTVGLEEEFAVLDSDLALTPGFERLRDAAASDPVLAESIAGELISSEIEIRSGRGADLAAAIAAQRDRRREAVRRWPPSWVTGWAAPARIPGRTTASRRSSTPSTTTGSRTGSSTWPGATTRSRSTSTWGSAEPTGRSRCVTGCGRCSRCCWPISASSPFLDGRDSGLASARSQIFTKSFPRCGVPDAFGSWDAFARYVEFLDRTGSIVEYTQVWWSVRPHPAFGTVEVRICDCQVTAQESEALASLIVACVAQAARDVDEGVP